jgi:transcriptional regulator NrdR family protein
MKPRILRLKECPACPHCGHERGVKLHRRRSGPAIRERWQCAPKPAGCGRRFTSWNTARRIEPSGATLEGL